MTKTPLPIPYTVIFERLWQQREVLRFVSGCNLRDPVELHQMLLLDLGKHFEMPWLAGDPVVLQCVWTVALAPHATTAGSAHEADLRDEEEAERNRRDMLEGECF